MQSTMKHTAKPASLTRQKQHTYIIISKPVEDRCINGNIAHYHNPLQGLYRDYALPVSAGIEGKGIAVKPDVCILPVYVECSHINLPDKPIPTRPLPLKGRVFL